MEVVWLPKALENLKEIHEFIKQESPQSARMVAERIQKTVEVIRDNPHIGRSSLVDGFREVSISKLPFVIPYKVLDEKIIIVRVFHTKQRPIIWE